MVQFHAQYEKNENPKRPITKNAIFHYVYGVLHDPIYREKYVQNLKREFPRIPFYADFWKWAELGEKLMALHIGYESVKPQACRSMCGWGLEAELGGLASALHKPRKARCSEWRPALRREIAKSERKSN